MIYVCVKLYASKKTKYMPMFNFVTKKKKKKTVRQFRCK